MFKYLNFIVIPPLRKYIFPLLILLSITSFKKKEITWVAIGDSITYLNDHPSETGNRVRKGYLTRVVEKMPYLHYINQGHNGWTAGNIAEQIDSLGLIKADMYSIFLGTNDWWAGRHIGTLEDYQYGEGNLSICGSFRIIIDKIRQLNPNARIFLITPMQRLDFVYIADKNNNAYGSYKSKNGQMLEQVANAIIKIGNLEKIPVIDLYHDKRLSPQNLIKFKRVRDPATGNYANYTYPFLNNTIFNPVTDDYPYPVEAINLTYDGLHPSDKGNAIIAKRIVQLIKQFDFN